MREAEIVELLQMLNLQRIRSKDNWVAASCPFAPVKHSKGSDSSPSFGVSVHPNKESHYNCFSCHSHGPLSYLPTALANHFSADYSKAREHIMQHEIFGLPDYEGKDEEEYEIDYAPAIDEVAREKFSRAQSWTYSDRGITAKTAKAFGFMYDDYEERLVIPIRDSQKRLVGLRGRYLGKEKGLVRYRAYTELSSSGSDPKRFGVWFGDDRPLNREKILTIVEGEMDLILLWQTGLVSNIRASMGSQLTRLQLRKLADHNMPVLLFLDNDKAGESAMRIIIDKLKGFVPIYKVRNYLGMKDPAEIVQSGKIKESLKIVDKVA